jgi:hypothetical protein
MNRNNEFDHEVHWNRFLEVRDPPKCRLSHHNGQVEGFEIVNKAMWVRFDSHPSLKRL